MKILHLVPTLSAGGAETFVADLAAAQRGLGHEVDVFLLAGVRGARGEALSARLTAAGVNCFGTPPRSPRAPKNIWQLLRHIVAGRYDVIHAHLFSIELVLAALLPLLWLIRARPLIVRTLHNSNIYGTRSPALARFLARAFDWNFACGRKVLQNYAQIFGSSRASAIENGVATATPDRSTPAVSIRQLRGLPADAFVVACVGAFRGTSLATGQKAQDVALRAFHLAFGTDPSAQLLFAGDGELRAEAEALAKELGCTGNVHFLGNLADVQPLLREIDLLFMPSRYEGLPMVGLEAGCAGVPVLASSIPELVEVGTPYDWRFSQDNSADDFARQLMVFRHERASLLAQAQAMSGPFQARYGMDRCAADYLAGIQSLLDQRTGPKATTKTGQRAPKQG